MKLVNNFFLIIFFPLLFILFSCREDKKGRIPVKTDVSEVKEVVPYAYVEDTLVALVDNSLTSYYIYKGLPFGFEYEMMALFAKENNMVLRIKIIRDAAHILDSLNAGKGDVAAANLTINRERLGKANFTKYLFRTRQVLVQRLPEHRTKMTKDQIQAKLVRDRLDLEGKTVYLRPNTSYYQRLYNFVQETNTGVSIRSVPDDVLTEELIEQVSHGDIDFTISDENKAKMYSAYMANIDIATPMSLSEPIGWAVNKNATGLLEKLNAWIEKRKGSLIYNNIWNKYFKLDPAERRRVKKKLTTYKKDQLSPFDDIIKTYARQINWDWILLVAQINQESQFNPKARSKPGAIGLMQLLPRTAKELGFNKQQLYVPEDNIKAGTKHLAWLRKEWEKSVADSVDLIKFTLGSYNVGYGHIRDAQRLATKYGLNPNKWDDNVAEMLIKKSTSRYSKDPVVKYGYCRGVEPVDYVKTIFADRRLYKNFLQ